MKETMADNCEKKGGIPTYEYRSISKKSTGIQQLLFAEDENYEIVRLAEDLCRIYKNKTATRKQIYEEHNIGRPYIANNYKDALLILEKENKISIDPPVDKRRKHEGKPTLGESLIIKF
jgi:hypothetical protein